VIFLVDSSLRVSKSNFVRQKEFVKQIGRQLNIMEGRSRGALVSYGNTARISFSFDNYTTAEDFERSVERAPYVGGNRRTDKALEAARELVSKARPHFPTLVVLLTAGRQGPGAGSLITAAQPLRKPGVAIYAVSIGPETDDTELRQVVKKPQNLIKIKEFTDLRPKVQDVAKQVSTSMYQNIFVFFDMSSPLLL
jgi:hypothetical protein